MDSTIRMVVKSVTWQALGLGTMTLIGYLFTGSVSQGGGIALFGAAMGLVTYFLHETLWARVGWGRTGRRD